MIIILKRNITNKTVQWLSNSIHRKNVSKCVFSELPHMIVNFTPNYHELWHFCYFPCSPSCISVRKCLEAIRFILPKEAAMKVGGSEHVEFQLQIMY